MILIEDYVVGDRVCINFTVEDAPAWIPELRGKVATVVEVNISRANATELRSRSLNGNRALYRLHWDDESVQDEHDDWWCAKWLKRAR